MNLSWIGNLWLMIARLEEGVGVTREVGRRLQFMADRSIFFDLAGTVRDGVVARLLAGVRRAAQV